MGCVERDREIKRRRSRKAKLIKLRALFAKATTDLERNQIVARARKISPLVTANDLAAQPS